MRHLSVSTVLSAIRTPSESTEVSVQQHVSIRATGVNTMSSRYMDSLCKYSKLSMLHFKDSSPSSLSIVANRQ